VGFFLVLIHYEPPFTDLNDQGISGVFNEKADLIKIASIIDQMNENAITA
jgi:type I restriction enzyme R subunit